MHREAEDSQTDMFRSRLDQQIDSRHQLVKLTELIPWAWLETELSSLIDTDSGPRMVTMGVPIEQSSFLEEEGEGRFARNAGKPSKTLRLMAGLQYLEDAQGLSDEKVCATWMENPDFQLLTGEIYFQTQLPGDSSSLTLFRQALGEEGVETLLMATIEAVKSGRFAKRQSIDRIIVDTTVQEKAVAHPTDNRLYEKPVDSWLMPPRRKVLSCDRVMPGSAGNCPAKSLASPMPSNSNGCAGHFVHRKAVLVALTGTRPGNWMNQPRIAQSI